MNVALIFHTIKYLHVRQIIYRIVHAYYHPSISNRSLDIRPAEISAYFPAIKKSTMKSLSTFSFLNHEITTDSPDFWNDRRLDALWLYNLHYFDGLNATGNDALVEIHRQLINKWIAENPYGRGIGWDSYPLSLRIVNWIKWHAGGGGLSSDALNSLAMQARYLFRRIEYHLLANHLFANAKALIFAGLFFEGKEADSWLKKGLEILVRELPEQILDDGGNYERSPMYHVIMTEDLLDLIALFRVYDHPSIDDRLINHLTCTVQKMISWLSAMCHGDRKIALFNDAAFGIAPEIHQLCCYAETLGVKNTVERIPLADLSDSGYFSVKNDCFTLIIDAGAIGPAYQPGHAHADTLSFELSTGERRLIVDSGTSCYGTSAERLRQRKTAAHNTVSIDGYDSSEVWSGFRVARRAKIIERMVEQKDNLITIQAAHDGFGRISGVKKHRRIWEIGTDSITIQDEIDGKGIHEIEAFIHFHPELDIELSENVYSVFFNGKKAMILYLDREMQSQVVGATYHPAFGVSENNKKLVMRIRTRLPSKFTTKIVVMP